MRFCWSTLMVKNLEESLAFYQNIVGLAVKRRFYAGTDTELAFLGDGDTEVELICNKSKQKIDAGKDISWGFETDSLDGVISLLTKKGIAFTGPFQPNPHVRFIYANDPDGMKIQFVQNL